MTEDMRTGVQHVLKLPRAKRHCCFAYWESQKTIIIAVRSSAGSDAEMAEALTGYTAGSFGLVRGRGVAQTVMAEGALAAR
ncbi:hypothetical protein MRX96_016905 [Rhipicephalus microplus]